jgi:tripartite-type tricarboxylate transporter receptor subunit TctC
MRNNIEHRSGDDIPEWLNHERRARTSVTRIAPFALLVGVCGAMPAAAQTPAEFYAGKTVTIVVGSSVGGGYDSYARNFARFVGNHIPGKPRVIVQNMPGGGSLTAVLHLDAGAPKDGTVMTIFNPGVLTEAVTNPGKAKVNFSEVGWIGSITRSVRMCYFWHGTGIKTWEDLNRPQPITMGATGVNSGNYNDIAILKNLFKRNVRAILGYPGRAEGHLAIERGELDGECGTPDGMPEGWLRDKKVNIVVKMVNKPNADIPDTVPWIGKYAASEEDLQVLGVLMAANELGRPIIVSKQVPPDRLQALRAAFDATMQDKEFLAMSEKQDLPANQPAGGEEAEQIVAKLYQVPPAVAERAKDIIK